MSNIVVSDKTNLNIEDYFKKQEERRIVSGNGPGFISGGISSPSQIHVAGGIQAVEKAPGRQDITGLGGLGASSEIVGFYRKVEGALDSCLVFMSHLYKNQSEALNSIAWSCNCDPQTLYPISTSYCTKCNKFPGSKCRVVIIPTTNSDNVVDTK